ncbi:MAG: indolepyruvate oxidoreductase subunit beta family protein, partial [Betaproteobacteria bacterium]|nr:indolepyruvate oxidoreductase subunit beta family protein [Betaproteobacteria bacterium]
MTEAKAVGSQETLPERPFTILVAALGGEGGGVLAEWLVDAATASGYPVQSTSIPGVAQRTGATTYYVEIYPVTADRLAGRPPVLALTPSPGNVDAMIASEFVEAGRAMQNGFVSPDRTTLVASTHRVFTVAEKAALGDGRFDEGKLHKAAESLAKRAVLFDMAEIARQSGTVINAVMFGALAGAGILPFSREACEAAIRKQGKGTEASLRGFASGFAHASGTATAPETDDGKRHHDQDTASAPRSRRTREARLHATFPAETYRIVEEGVARVRGYQDQAYADLYADRLARILAAEKASAASTGFPLTNETGRLLALWMTYEDIIRVADLKTRRSRFERVRAEVGAKPDEPVVIVEYLKPGINEICDILPRTLATRVRTWAARSGKSLNVGVHLKTSSVFGFLLLRAMAWLRPLRRRTFRYGEEQARIESWLAAIEKAASRDAALALEVAQCARLVKGYGDTHHRGWSNFERIMATLVEGEPQLTPAERTAAIRKARLAALADAEGKALTKEIGDAKPVIWLT